MKFTKYLRDNSRTFLMVFMALLLVAFLVPQSIQNWSDRGEALKVPLGQVFGRALTTADLQQTAADVQMLTRAGLRVPEPVDYYLLSEEAKQTGLEVGHDEVQTQFGQGQAAAALQELQRTTRMSYDRIFEAFGRRVAVERLARLAAGGLVDSLPRQELAYRDRTQQGVADCVALDDKAFLHLVPEPTEAELQAFFEAAKDRKTNHTDEQMEFGYLLPDRVRLEYLTVNPDKIRSKVTVQAAQVKRFFEENQQRYMKPDPTATQPAAGGKPPQVPMTFDEVKERAREDCREARAIELAQSQINDMYTEAHRPWAAAPRDAEGFATPPDAPPVSFEEFKQRFSAKLEVEYGQTELVGGEKLGTIPGLGGANMALGRGEVLRVSELALRVKGLLAKDPADGKPVLNLLEPAPVMLSQKLDPQSRKGSPHQAFLFRVIQLAPSGPPGSVDEVRTQLVPDWKLSQAHELAGQHATQLAAKARAVGVRAAVAQATELKDILAAAEKNPPPAVDPTAPAPPTPKYVDNFQAYSAEFTRQAGVVLRVGRVPEIVKALFARADTPVAEGARRVQASPVARQNKWLVAEVTGVKPIFREPFETQLAQTLKTNRQRDIQRFATDWLTPQNIKGRTGFVPAKPDAQPTEP